MTLKSFMAALVLLDREGTQ